MAEKLKECQVTLTKDTTVPSERTRTNHCVVGATVIWLLAALVREVYGLLFLKDCPRELTILLVLLFWGLFTLLWLYIVNVLRETNTVGLSRKKPKCPRAGQLCLLGLIVFTIVVTGCVWFFSVHQLHPSHTVFCTSDLYLFVFCNAFWDIYAICFIVFHSSKENQCEVAFTLEVFT